MLAAQRQGPLGNVRSRLTSSWVAGECTQGAWEYLHWESAQWKKYTTNMVACPRCYELGSSKCLDGQARCTCSEGSSGWRTMGQQERDDRSDSRRPACKKSPVEKEVLTRAEPCCKLLSGGSHDGVSYFAVPSVVTGQGRRDRWVVVSMTPSSPGWHGRCSHQTCITERHTRLAACVDTKPVFNSCVHIDECMRILAPPATRDSWDMAICGAYSVSLDGCLAHVASGSRTWACGGLRQCEPCGFVKEDVVAESLWLQHSGSSGLDAGPPLRGVPRGLPKPWFMPEGYEVQEEAPREEVLMFGNEEGQSLVGRVILYNWFPPVYADKHSKPSTLCPPCRFDIADDAVLLCTAWVVLRNH